MRCTEMRILLLGFVLGATLAGCVAPSSPSHGTLLIEGKVSHKEIEGGFWAIDADDGRKFTPLNLPTAFQQDNLAVTVRAKFRPDAAGMHMYGVPITILEIKKRP
jgi:hypothetical protein